MAYSGLPNSDLSSDLTSSRTSEFTASSDEEPEAPTSYPEDPAPTPSPQVRLSEAPMVVCPLGGRHVVPSWMVEFHLNHCRCGCSGANQGAPGSPPHATENWEAECEEPSPLALAAAKQPFFQPASPFLSKGQRKKHYRGLVAQYREARALQARYDLLGDDEQPGPSERPSSAEPPDDMVSTATERMQLLEVGAASPHNAELQDDAASYREVAADPGFGDDDDDETVKAVDEDGTTFYMGRGRGLRTPFAASPRYADHW